VIEIGLGLLLLMAAAFVISPIVIGIIFLIEMIGDMFKR
jgi:hypothetical protein